MDYRRHLVLGQDGLDALGCRVTLVREEGGEDLPAGHELAEFGDLFEDPEPDSLQPRTR